MSDRDVFWLAACKGEKHENEKKNDDQNCTGNNRLRSHGESITVWSGIPTSEITSLRLLVAFSALAELGARDAAKRETFPVVEAKFRGNSLQALALM